MTVKELIELLLDFEMDTDIEIELSLNSENSYEDFDIEEATNGDARITVDLSDEVLVESDRYEELEQAEERLEELEDEENE